MGAGLSDEQRRRTSVGIEAWRVSYLDAELHACNILADEEVGSAWILFFSFTFGHVDVTSESFSFFCWGASTALWYMGDGGRFCLIMEALSLDMNAETNEQSDWLDTAQA